MRIYDTSECLNMISYSDECELFYDMDEEDLVMVLCDNDGLCFYKFESCPFYTPAWGVEDE